MTNLLQYILLDLYSAMDLKAKLQYRTKIQNKDKCCTAYIKHSFIQRKKHQYCFSNQGSICILKIRYKTDRLSNCNTMLQIRYISASSF